MAAAFHHFSPAGVQPHRRQDASNASAVGHKKAVTLRPESVRGGRRYGGGCMGMALKLRRRNRF